MTAVVVYVDFGSVTPKVTGPAKPCRPVGAVVGATGEAPPVGRPLPLRWSPEPVRVLHGRYARSQLAADLDQYGRLLVLLLFAVLGAFIADHLVVPALIEGTHP